MAFRAPVTPSGASGNTVNEANRHNGHQHHNHNNSVAMPPNASGQSPIQMEHYPLLHFLDSITTVGTLSSKDYSVLANSQKSTNNNHNKKPTINNNPDANTGNTVIATCVRNSCPDRPFMCSLCRKAFSQQSTIINHLKTHTGKKPYKCKVCEKEFRQVATLNNHMKIHTGEKPYSCSYCPKQFRQKSTLNNHVRTHGAQWKTNINAINQ